MSVDATIWAWKSPVQSSAQRVVLLSMADRAGEGHTCYPSVSRLAQDCCLDRKTVMRAIDQLEQLGLVRDTGSIRGNGVKVYQLIGVTGREDVPRTEKTTSTKSGTSTKNDTSTKIGTDTSTKNGTSTSTKNGTQNLPIEPISEPNNNIKRSDIAKTNKFDFKAKLIENGVSEKLATEFMQVRKAKGGVG
ncbi:helix-turn-helix domain-containing protein [Acinetobacter soli]|uniref:helix-turn-helix domain-containing protein n=1 Tax=Acinetobacter soli TaxID=487316 RepID=UPI002FF094AB